MLTFNMRVAHEFDKLIKERVEPLSEAVVGGQLSESEYKHWTGQIRGLREAPELLAEAISICEGKDRE